ncbi:MAG: peptide deformylase [Rickettsiales bacterium]|jgi:peptide deformylase|nr:peptide deformylase [Rickettsiales bacterium]
MKNDLEIFQVGNPVLRETALWVEFVDDELREILSDMERAMFANDGAGLAAPQVGLNKRMFVARIGADVVKMINPELSDFSDEKITMEEGCLSVLGTKGPVFADVVRPESVRVKWTDENGHQHNEIFEGIPSRIIQHEYDHLDGVLFIDKISGLRRMMILSKVKKAQK